MIESRWTRRFSSTLSLLLLLWAGPGLAAEVTLRPFSASYKLYEGGFHVADTRLSLEREGDTWYWRMVVKPYGVFSLLTRKQPYAETAFSNDADSFRIQHILVTDGRDKGKDESARFDWQNGKIDVVRKGKTKQLELPAEIYDYQSVHVAAAAMNRQNTDRKTIDFYRKGRLRESLLVVSGEGSVEVNGSSLPAVIFDQTITKSGSRVRYYYDSKNPILPLRIERSKSGDGTSIMILHQVEWTM